jgi:archaemetzincin
MLSPVALGAGPVIADGRPGLPPFVVPGKEARVLAIGDVSSLGPVWRKLLEPHPSDFQPMAPPSGPDWLNRRQEQGQTFRRFAFTKRNVVTPHRRKIYLLPVPARKAAPGAPRAAAVQTLREFASAYYQLPAAVLSPLSLDALKVEFRTGRRGQEQASAASLLDGLEALVPPDAFALVGVAEGDLFGDPRWAYQFGMARPAKRVAVVSTARFGTAPADGWRGTPGGAALARSCKVLGHEIGHLFGMNHCIFFRCVMNGSNHLREADARPVHLCPVCLRKAGSAVRFSLPRRYRQLQDFYRRTGLRDEAEWAERRLFRARLALECAGR